MGDLIEFKPRQRKTVECTHTVAPREDGGATVVVQVGEYDLTWQLNKEILAGLITALRRAERGKSTRLIQSHYVK